MRALDIDVYSTDCNRSVLARKARHVERRRSNLRVWERTQLELVHKGTRVST
jgi:hypothetical protein